jgi:hypothetical protein
LHGLFPPNTRMRRTLMQLIIRLASGVPHKAPSVGSNSVTRRARDAYLVQAQWVTSRWERVVSLAPS